MSQLDDRLTLRKYGPSAPLARKSLSAQVTLERRMVDACDLLETLLDRRHTQQHKDLCAIRNLATQQIAEVEQILRQTNDVDATFVNGGASAEAMPVICVNTKLCTQLDLAGTLRAFADQQWKVDTAPWAEAFEDLDAARERMRVATAEWSAETTLAYCSSLIAVQRRFFDNGQNGSLLFKWHDAVTGEESLELSVFVELASVLFNAGALHMQHAALQDRTTETGLRLAQHDYEAAAGIFRHLLKKRLVNTSLDLSQTMLSMLSAVCLAQAQECIWRLAAGAGAVPPGPEAALVSRLYGMARSKMLQPELFAKIPALWGQQAKFKMLFFEAISHLLVGQAGGPQDDNTLHEASMVSSLLHLRHAHNLFGEAASHARVFLADCPGLISAATEYITQTAMRINAVEGILFAGRAASKNKKAYKRAAKLAAKQHFYDTLLRAKSLGFQRRYSIDAARSPGVVPLVPYIWGQARVSAQALEPIALDMLEDPFEGLGSALHAGVTISACRTHFLHAKHYTGDWAALGLVLAGDGATLVESVARDSVAALAGFVAGMILASVGDHGVLHLSQPVVQSFINDSFYSQGWAEVSVLVPFKDFDPADIFEVEFASRLPSFSADGGHGPGSPRASMAGTSPFLRSSRESSQRGPSAVARRSSSFKQHRASRRTSGFGVPTSATEVGVVVAC